MLPLLEKIGNQDFDINQNHSGIAGCHFNGRFMRASEGRALRSGTSAGEAKCNGEPSGSKQSSGCARTRAFGSAAGG